MAERCFLVTKEMVQRCSNFTYPSSKNHPGSAQLPQHPAPRDALAIRGRLLDVTLQLPVQSNDEVFNCVPNPGVNPTKTVGFDHLVGGAMCPWDFNGISMVTNSY